MYTTVRELQRCRVQAIDHEAGVVADVLFDDRSWCVRYVVADSGRWLRRHRVLLTPSVLAGFDAAERTLYVALSAADVERRPSVDADPPVAVLMEQRLHDVVKLAASWVAGFGEPYVYPLTPPAPGLHYAPPEPSPATAWLHAGDSHLRSASHVLGHHVEALDGPAGSVEDLVIDDAGWRVTDLVVQANRQHRTSQLVPARWVDDVSWGMRTVHVRVAGDRIDPVGARRLSSKGAGRRPPWVRSS